MQLFFSKVLFADIFTEESHRIYNSIFMYANEQFNDGLSKTESWEKYSSIDSKMLITSISPYFPEEGKEEEINNKIKDLLKIIEDNKDIKVILCSNFYNNKKCKSNELDKFSQELENKGIKSNKLKEKDSDKNYEIKIDDDELEIYMNSFFGYGNIKNPEIIFVGMEEGGELINNRLRNIKRIKNEKKIENFIQKNEKIDAFTIDMEIFHSLIGMDLIFFKRNQATWSTIFKLYNFIANKTENPKNDNKIYKDFYNKFKKEIWEQQTSINGNILLTELLPLPSPRNTDKAFEDKYIKIFEDNYWEDKFKKAYEEEQKNNYINKNFGKLSLRDKYELYIFDKRLAKIQKIIENSRMTKSVIFYGKGYIKSIKKYFKFNDENLIKEKLKTLNGNEINLKLIKKDNINYYFLNHFTSRGMNSFYILTQIANIIKSNE